MRWLPLALLLAACEDGPSEETLVDDVQVIAAVAEPLVVAPGESWTLETHVADPKERGAEVLLWACLDEECQTERVTPEDEIATLDVVSAVPIPLWILACDPGICELDDPDPADLLDPFSWMQRLPLEGVSLSTRQVNLVEEPIEPAPVNPSILAEPPISKLEGVRKGDKRVLDFQVEGASIAWAFSTGGGFERPSFDVADDGSVSLVWYAPEKRSSVRLYVVFESEELGGTVVWRDEVAVR